MKSIYILLVMGITLVACGGLAQEITTSLPTPTIAPKLTVTATPALIITPSSPVETGTFSQQVAENVVYANVSDKATTLDVYTPDEAGTWPVVVVAHGWSQQKLHLEDLARSIASQGAVVYNINVSYTVPFLNSIERLACAIRYARATAADYDGDPNWITMVGISAGGGAGIVVSLSGDDFEGDCVVNDGSALPNAFVGYEGTYEFVTTNYGNIIDHTYLEQENPELFDAINPYSYIGHNPDLQVRLVHGEDDDTTWYDIAPEESIELYQTLSDSGYDVELVLVEGASHLSHLYSTTEGFALTVQQVMELANSSSK